MPIAQIITLLFVLMAILMIVYTFIPTRQTWPPIVSIPRIIWLVVGLIVLYIVYLIVLALVSGLPGPH